jgi:hypothetical protein
MKTFRDVGVKSHVFLISAVDEGGQLYTSACFPPISLNRSLSGALKGCGLYSKEKNLYPHAACPHLNLAIY